MHYIGWGFIMIIVGDGYTLQNRIIYVLLQVIHTKNLHYNGR
jgi:hypothetical protein